MAEAFYLTRAAMDQDRETTWQTLDSFLESASPSGILTFIVPPAL